MQFCVRNCVGCNPKTFDSTKFKKQMNRQPNASVKLKELQSNAQSQRFAANLILIQQYKNNQQINFINYFKE